VQAVFIDGLYWHLFVLRAGRNGVTISITTTKTAFLSLNKLCETVVAYVYLIVNGSHTTEISAMAALSGVFV
jgi:hypothetical protein